MNSKVYIKSAEDSAALRYTLDFIFVSFFGLDYQLCLPDDGIPEGSIIVCYGTDSSEGCHIPSSGYLSENSFNNHPTLQISEWDGLPVFFESNGQIPFDLFAAVFFLIARVEEYVITDRDSHGRFQLKDSILSELAFQKRPIIDEWLINLSKHISAAFPNFKPKKRSFKWLNTFDIDIAFAYSNRTPLRMLAATGKNILNGDFTAVKQRIQVLRNQYPDPFDTYDLQEEVAKKGNAQTHYFFLLGNGGPLDRNIAPSRPGLIGLIKRLRAFATIGIHPSYLSGDKHSELKSEIGHLNNILGEPITTSRQHYLRMNLPETYNRLIAEGIKDDFTMGYAEGIGFRSGTCTPHFFFDVLANKTTELKVHPLAIMEGTLRDYLKLSADEAPKEMEQIINRVAAVNGTFISLWHNDSLRNDIENPWRQVFIHMVDYIETNFVNR